jgi:tetratricopeptide (TPR) repeat protein
MIERSPLQELADTARAHLTGPEQSAWLRRLEEGHDAFTSTLQTHLERGEADAGLALAASLGRFWWMCGHAVEGRRWLEAFLARSAGNEELRARALAAVGGVTYAQADYAAAQRFHSEALDLFTGLGNRIAQAEAHNQLGMIAREQARYAEARRRHEAALTLYREHGDEWGIASCLSNLGVVAYFAGDLEQARLLHGDALHRRQKLGDERGVASSLGNLANLDRLAGDLESARKLHEQVLTIREGLGDRWGVAGSLLNLGIVHTAAKELEKARQLLFDAEDRFRAVGDSLGLCECLDAQAELAARAGSASLAVRLFAAAETARAGIGAPLPDVHRPHVRQTLAALRQALGREDFEREWQRGVTDGLAALAALRQERLPKTG